MQTIIIVMINASSLYAGDPRFRARMIWLRLPVILIGPST
jgi:hypothetical protein